MSLLRSRARRGATLIEVVIVIAIIGILAMMTVPNLEAWISRLRLNAATQHIKSQIDNTRKLAISETYRYCISFTGDASFSNGNDSGYLVQTTVREEEAPFYSGVWTTVSWPDFQGFTNNATTALYPGISLETGGNSTTFGTTANCTGLLINMQGYLANPQGEFAFPCGGTNCAKLTLRNKSVAPRLEQRTLWIDRGGNVRITSSPSVPPVLGG